jgi:hypothetical protein
MKRVLLAALVVAAGAWLVFGVVARGARAERRSAVDTLAARGLDVRGAFHVHTTASDGRGTLAEVIAAARQAGLAFVVVTDHNLRVPERPVYVDGVLVIPATEASTRYGHVVAVGTPRALTPAERDGDPLAAIRALGGEAVLAHPLHPRRPFTGWGTGPWRGFEIVSNDTAWGRVVAERAAGKVVNAAVVLAWDAPRAVLALEDDPADELARFDAELAAAPRMAAEARRPPRVLLCSADAHGYPSYAAAFEAFSMHVPVALTGDAAGDAAAVGAALLDGRAACVFEGVGAAAGVALAPAPGGALALAVSSASGAGATYALVRDGAPLGRFEPAPAGAGGTFRCAGPCPPGTYRAEVRRGGRPWIFTNPVTIE